MLHFRQRESIGDTLDFQYLDLVDASQSNVWVSPSEGTTVCWKLPAGAAADSVKILLLEDLHREYGVDADDVTGRPHELGADVHVALDATGGVVTMADGAEVRGTWGWVNADARADAADAYQALFTPTEGAENYQALYTDVGVGVTDDGGVDTDGQGGGAGVVIDSTNVNDDDVGSGAGQEQTGPEGGAPAPTGENAVALAAGIGTLLAMPPAFVIAAARKRSRGEK